MTNLNEQRQIIVPSGLEPMYEAFHFAPATRVGNTIWVSGQVGIDSALRPADGMEAQARLAFGSLKYILEFAGASLADVVELNTFHTDLRDDLPAFTLVKDEHFPEHFPSWTAVGVTELALPGLCIEIRAVAVIGSGNRLAKAS